MTPRLEALLEFLELTDRFKSVYRAAYLSDQTRHESDAEHTWHLCLLAMLLHEETSLDVDIGKVLEMIVVHDLVEIFAGDTPLHAEEGHSTKHERELDAADRLFGELPEDVGSRLRELWQEFEAAETPESRFVIALDRLQAFAQNAFAGGRTWREFKVTEELSRQRNERAMSFDSSIREAFEIVYRRAVNERMWFAE